MNLNINYISCRLLDIKVLSIIKLQVCNIGEGVGVTCSINVVRLAAVSSAVQCYTCNLIIGACAILGLVDEFQKWVTLESNGHRNCCSKRIIIFRF